MTKGLLRSLARGSALSSAIKKETVTFTSKTITVDGESGVGFGSTVIMTLPECQVLILGCVLDVTCTKTTANIIDTWEGDISVGTGVNDDVTLDGDEINIIASTVTPEAAAGVAAFYKAIKNPDLIDNTDGNLNINLNLLVDDNDISADAQKVDITGYFHILYSCLGDN